MGVSYPKIFVEGVQTYRMTVESIGLGRFQLSMREGETVLTLNLPCFVSQHFKIGFIAWLRTTINPTTFLHTPQNKVNVATVKV
ncbi:hypothetical protein FQZ97_1201550 [compost metagenome]